MTKSYLIASLAPSGIDVGRALQGRRDLFHAASTTGHRAEEAQIVPFDGEAATPIAVGVSREPMVCYSVCTSSPRREVDVFSRIAIVNRGESAMRLIHAVQELNAEGAGDLRTIALHTDAERGAMFVREADEAERIGATGDGHGGGARISPYLDHRELERGFAPEASTVTVAPPWGTGVAPASGRAGCASIPRSHRSGRSP